MQKTPIFVFGNPDYAPDALPLKLIPYLQNQLPEIEFIVKDPNEDFKLPDPLIIVDTVQGIKELTVFNSLDQFVNTPNITVHDFDLGMKLKWLNKLGKLPQFTIIGIPMNSSKEHIQTSLVSALKNLIN